MSNYSEFRDAKVVIARELAARGWKIYGFHEDESDGMTDYYDPAYWNGIAEKNGYIVNIDCSVHYSGQEDYFQRKTKERISEKDKKRIQALMEVRQDRGASEEEERSAKEKIELIRSKYDGEDKEIYKVYYPVFQENPGRCTWHVEKNGKIIIKGNGIRKFSELLLLSRNINKESYRAEERKKLWMQLDTFINRIDTAAGAVIGSSDDKYEYRITTKVKYKHKNIIVEKETGKLEDGAIFVCKEYLGYERNKGYVYRLHEKDGYWTAMRMNSALTRERTGHTRGVHFGSMDKEYINRLLERGAIKWCEIVDQATPYEVQKVVKSRKG